MAATIARLPALEQGCTFSGTRLRASSRDGRRALLDCFSWSEETFRESAGRLAIRRIGFERWRHNVAVAWVTRPQAEVTSSCATR